MARRSSKILRYFALACVLCVGLAGCSSADESTTDRVIIRETTSPQETQLPPGPVDIDAAMQARLNDVLTTAYWSLPSHSVVVSEMTVDERVNFAFVEGYLHGTGLVQDNLEWVLSFDNANKSLERYLGRPLTQADTANVSKVKYSNGFFRIPMFEGLLIYECAVADSLERQEDGTYKAQFTAWEYPANMDVDDGLTSPQAKSSSDYTRLGSGSAVLESYTYDGKETYRIVSYNYVEGGGEEGESLTGQNAPFWGVWISAHKDNASAQKAAAATGMPEVQVVVTSEWKNLNSETWYALTYGRYGSEADAKQARQKILSKYPDAYVKYSGGHR